MRGSSLLGAIALLLLSSLYGTPGLAQGTPERPPKGYVVSLGLYNEPVFRREASLAARVLGAYYGRGGTVRVYPNQKNPAVPNSIILPALLVSVPSSMDRQNDVLIVFLTSHGSEDGITIKSGRSLELLTPDRLRGMLDATGVKRKVLIVSACHSGVFTPLANPTTAVITASDAYSSSFGCTATAKSTYFGGVLLGLAIPDAPTLPAAFGNAVPLVRQIEDASCSPNGKISAAERKKRVERGKCFQFSNPQMAGGWEFINTWRAASVPVAFRDQIQKELAD